MKRILKAIKRFFVKLFERVKAEEPEILEDYKLKPGWVMIKRRMRGGRIPLTQPAEIVRQNKKTLWVRIPSGDVIKRHRRDIEAI